MIFWDQSIKVDAEVTKPSNVSTNSNTVNKVGKSIDGMDEESESDVEHVIDETTSFMAPKSGGGAGGKSYIRVGKRWFNG